MQPEILAMLIRRLYWRENPQIVEYTTLKISRPKICAAHAMVGSLTKNHHSVSRPIPP